MASGIGDRSDQDSAEEANQVGIQEGKMMSLASAVIFIASLVLLLAVVIFAVFEVVF